MSFRSPAGAARSGRLRCGQLAVGAPTAGGRLPAPDLNIFAGEITELVFQGDTSLAYVRLAEGTVIAVRATTPA